MVEDYKLWSTTLALTSVTSWHPDDGLPSNAEIDLALRIESATVTALIKGGPALSRPLERASFAALVDLGRVAVAEGNGESGVDTAVGRHITRLEIELVETHLKAPPARAVYSMNHCAPSHRGPASWRRLLEAIGGSSQEPALVAQLAWFQDWFAAP